MMTQSVLNPKVPKTFSPRAARVVVALADPRHATAVGHAFRHQGWEVHVPGVGTDLRDLIRRSIVRAAVLDAQPTGVESGWLTCKKLLMERPMTKVVLVSGDPSAADRRLAAFVGATALLDASNPLGVVSAVMGLRLSSLN